MYSTYYAGMHVIASGLLWHAHVRNHIPRPIPKIGFRRGLGTRLMYMYMYFKILSGPSHLIECWVDIVCKLYLGNGSGALCGQPDAKPHYTLLRQGSVEHSL